MLRSKGRVPVPCLDCGRLSQAGIRCVSCHRALERKRNASPIRKKYADPVYRSQPKTGICHLCGRPGADTRDHLFQGSNVTLPAHRSCNSRKGRPQR
jgi:hypothetical protein